LAAAPTSGLSSLEVSFRYVPVKSRALRAMPEFELLFCHGRSSYRLRTFCRPHRRISRFRDATPVCSGPGRFVAATGFFSDLGCFGFLASRLDLFCPFDTAISLVPVREFALVNHPLLAVCVIFNSILRSIAIHRKQTNNGVAAFTSVVNAPAGEKINCLTHTEFMIHVKFSDHRV
jgi:hypothetical protein